MARVGILTFHYSNNYGAVLQAYGLSKAIRELGHEVQVIDYRPEAARRLYDKWPLHPKQLALVLGARVRFGRFRKECLPRSYQKYHTVAELSAGLPDVDCLICGSDQVWNIASFRGFDPAFFLDFGGAEGKRRISYAATFGAADDLGEHGPGISALLSRFDALSVRDLKSIDIVRSLTDNQVHHVLDPSFLTDYASITAERMIKEPYILIYCLGGKEHATFTRAVEVLRRKYNLPVISIKLRLEGTRMINPDPHQWLSLVRYADIVCTNSFHGLCFSIKNRKQFVALPVEYGVVRLLDLLETTGLQDRFIPDIDLLESTLDRSVDYDKVLPLIEEKRNRSLDYLKQALS